MDELLQQELCAVPLSLTTTDSSLRHTNKAELATILAEAVTETDMSVSDLSSCTIIDGMALVRVMGRPQGATTFGDLADEFTWKVKSQFRGNNTRVDVVFYRYQQSSVKSGTRAQRSTTLLKIHTIVKSREVEKLH